MTATLAPTVRLCRKCGVAPARHRCRHCTACVPPVPHLRPVWSDRPGEHWDSVRAAADAVGRSRGAIANALADGTRSAGRLWFARPPAWVAAAEAERVAAAYRVSPWWVAVGPGPAALNCEQRWAKNPGRAGVR